MRNQSLGARILRVLRDPIALKAAVQRRLNELRLSESGFLACFPSQAALRQLREELFESGIIEELDTQLQRFAESTKGTANGRSLGTGVISPEEGILLYALFRQTKPEAIVETGVCSGYSTALILQALELNQKGRLYSVDFPEILGEEYPSGTFWEGKGDAVVPAGFQSGWLVPERLRHRWSLTLGKSQDVLPALIERIGTIDAFIHDSEHSYECMTFEYVTAWPAIRVGGYLISDDIGWNNSFFDFAKSKKLVPGRMAGNMALIEKP